MTTKNTATATPAAPVSEATPTNTPTDTPAGSTTPTVPDFESMFAGLVKGVEVKTSKNVSTKPETANDNTFPPVPTSYLRATTSVGGSSAKTKCRFADDKYASRNVLAMSVFADAFLHEDNGEECGIPNQESTKWTVNAGRFGILTVVRNVSLSKVNPFVTYEMYSETAPIAYACTRCSSENTHKAYPDSYGAACERILDTIAPGTLDKLGVFIGINRASTYRLNVADIFTDSCYGGRGKRNMSETKMTD